jgi:hypothetical protein
MQLTVGVCPYNNAAAFAERMARLILPTLRHYPDYEAEIVCVDNSAVYNEAMVKPLAEGGVPFTYVWNNGRNDAYAGALNRMVSLARYPNFVYVCSGHGKLYDPTWLADILVPLADPRCGQAGTVAVSNYQDIGRQGFGWHIQGGLFAARTEVLRKFPYSPKYPHLYSDVWMSRELEDHGYRLMGVPTVASVWGRVVYEPHAFKVVHDHS